MLLQSLFDAIPAEDIAGSTLVLGGDGRYFNKEAAQVLILFTLQAENEE